MMSSGKIAKAAMAYGGGGDGSSNKEGSKAADVNDDVSLADTAFDAFYTAMKKGDADAAKASLKAFMHECAEYTSEGIAED